MYVCGLHYSTNTGLVEGHAIFVQGNFLSSSYEYRPRLLCFWCTPHFHFHLCTHIVLLAPASIALFFQDLATNKKWRNIISKIGLKPTNVVRRNISNRNPSTISVQF